MKGLILVIALFLFQSNTCGGRPFLDEKNEGDEVLPKVKKFVHSKEFNSKSNLARRDFLRGSQLLSLRRKDSDEWDDETTKMKFSNPPGWLRSRIALHYGLKEGKQLDTRTAERKVRRLQKMKKNIFRGKEEFPQTFQSLFTQKSLKDGLVDEMIDSNRRGYDFGKIIEDLTDIDWRNVEERRNSKKLNDEGRPPRPG